MPLELKPPRPGKSPNYSVRGTYLGQYVDRSTGSPDRATAGKVLKKIKREIESGSFAERKGKTFAGAVTSYLQGGGDDRFLDPLLDHFGETPIPGIDQEAIDAAAHALYPSGTPATRNRQVYTPVSAVLKHVGAEFELKRPKGHEGNKRVDWLTPDEANRIFEAAAKVDREFQILLIFLCYTGCRLGDALQLTCRDVHMDDTLVYVGKMKNGEARPVFIPPVLDRALKAHPKGWQRGPDKFFRFRKNGYLYNLMKATKKKAGGDLGWVTFHIFCHTYATWMRRYGGLDTKGLVGTGRWKDRKSVDRYEHVIVSEESRKALLLPIPKSVAK